MCADETHYRDDQVKNPITKLQFHPKLFSTSVNARRASRSSMLVGAPELRLPWILLEGSQCQHGGTARCQAPPEACGCPRRGCAANPAAARATTRQPFTTLVLIQIQTKRPEFLSLPGFAIRASQILRVDPWHVGHS